ncbi:Carbamoyl-phosphate synthase L chain ATP-binding protein [Asticcacaulis excentricus CB 48]|uniref:Carbamoyl-phosphate synthase L chain ATP-binding protein n=2 Tax=Asticcacaulis excentricus TaxID=78587 RepID=E8RLE8_ASTEC|nr:Carbamoyl-phosphate synthase L chain ATP-binding protein [Asticcacaulis excentricus CB 48]
MMFRKLLIANRGEIACRIIRTCQRLGIKTVAVYSEADAKALFVRQADEAHLIGPAPAAQSYLRGDVIIEVARRTGAEAIHPGYGFLSENAEFAEACAAAGIVFVGPTPEAIRAMALKGAAKALMEGAGVPVTPGYHAEAQDETILLTAAREIGFPVLIKAVAGGGGKGMRRVDNESDFPELLKSCQGEGQSAFGDPRVLIEKYIEVPRHIEIQLFADSHGNALHLYERDCSLQRRHQKVIEEAPAPGLPEAMRQAMGKAAVTAAKAIGYRGAGTIEFIVDVSKGIAQAAFYFMEMNTRLQVEHPVTEAITGLDLVEWQLRVAAGEALPLTQAQVPLNGHAIEARLYAEDPEHDFMPSTGTLNRLVFPSGVRADSAVAQGDTVSVFYDPMISKLIVHGKDRAAALDALRTALIHTRAEGLKTNLAFLRRIASDPDFRAGQIDTGFIGRHVERLTAPWPDLGPQYDLLTAAPPTPWHDATGFRLNLPPASPVDVRHLTDALDEAHEASEVLAPMPGLVVAVHIKEGETVEKNQPLIVLEAMKIQLTLKAPRAGVVTGLSTTTGEQVIEKAVLLNVT